MLVVDGFLMRNLILTVHQIDLVDQSWSESMRVSVSASPSSASV